MMDANQTGLACGEGWWCLTLVILAAMLLVAILVLAAAVVVLTLTIGAGFPHEEVLWMYIEFPASTTLTA